MLCLAPKKQSRFLAMNKGELGELRNMTVEELGWCARKVVSHTTPMEDRSERGHVWTVRNRNALVVCLGGARSAGQMQ